eukprot:GSChrysophyteH1.ASY1.ANO1.2792.1 assembled CDS
MSAMDVDAEPLEEEEAVPLDELVLAFEALDESTSDLTSYASIMSNERTDDAAIKIKERCIYRIAKIHTEKKNLEEVGALMKNQSDFFGMIPKAKTAKIVRNILDLVARIPDSIDIQMKLCEDLRIEARQCSLFLQKKKNSEGQELVTKLLGELKKLDDKQMLTEAKASLTASRSAANSIYVVPLLQAELDEMSGILCCEEGDHSTAFSYFQEAFDAYDGTLDSAAVRVLKYMVLSKTLSEKPGEAEALFTSKAGLKHSGAALEAMHAVSNAVRARSLEDFESAVNAHSEHLRTDDLISHHLTSLYDRMFEANLLKIIFPFSSVEISHVAQLINLPEAQVERKLSQMILDKKFSGILDQGKGFLEVFDSAEEDPSFTSTSQIVSNLGQVVSTLMTRARKFNNGGA